MMFDHFVQLMERSLSIVPVCDTYYVDFVITRDEILIMLSNDPEGGLLIERSRLDVGLLTCWMYILRWPIESGHYRDSNGYLYWKDQGPRMTRNLDRRIVEPIMFDHMTRWERC